MFGNLPSARPGVRSPRRESGRRGSKAPAEQAEPRVDESRPRPPSPPPRPPTASPPPRSEEPTHAEAEPGGEDEAGGGGVEDLAWAGIAVAAEAATLGVRLLSRAMGAVRGPADRP